MKREHTSTPSDHRTREDPPAGAGESGVARNRHPLLHAFPLTVLTIGAVLIVFVFAMAALRSGNDPDLQAANGTGIPKSAVTHTLMPGPSRSPGLLLH